jgi:hypothetical protein
MVFRAKIFYIFVFSLFRSLLLIQQNILILNILATLKTFLKSLIAERVGSVTIIAASTPFKDDMTGHPMPGAPSMMLAQFLFHLQYLLLCF